VIKKTLIDLSIKTLLTDTPIVCTTERKRMKGDRTITKKRKTKGRNDNERKLQPNGKNKRRSNDN